MISPPPTLLPGTRWPLPAQGHTAILVKPLNLVRVLPSVPYRQEPETGEQSDESQATKQAQGLSRV